MSGGQQLERSVLEGKERDKLHAIAEALGMKPTARAKKADLIDGILRAAGVADTPTGPSATRPKRAAPRRRVAEVAAEATEVAVQGVLAVSDEPPETVSSTLASTEPASTPVSTEPVLVAEPPPVALESPVVATTDASERAVPSLPPEPERPAVAGPPGPGNQAPPPAPSPTQGNQPHHLAPAVLAEGDVRRNRRRRGRDRDRLAGGFDQQAQQADQAYSGEPRPCEGVLDLRPEGFGFLRTSGYLTGPDDVYVSVSLVRRFDLRAGDRIVGTARPATTQERFGALQRIDTVSGQSPEAARRRPRFQDLTPVLPHEQVTLESADLDPAATTTARMIDLLAPLGKGQRALLVAPPKAGSTTVLTHIAQALEAAHPEFGLTVVVVSERPEEVTVLRRALKSQVIGSAFDRPAEEHTQIAELVIEEAKRQVEQGRDVIVLLDGITRLARAYGSAGPAKTLFGAARCLEEGGSLTILATARVDTGSTEDTLVLQELAGAANAEVHLSGRLAESRIYPAIDTSRSATGHDELLCSAEALPVVWQLRRTLAALDQDAAHDLLLDRFKHSHTNADLLAELAGTTGDPLPLEGSL